MIEFILFLGFLLAFGYIFNLYNQEKEGQDYNIYVCTKCGAKANGCEIGNRRVCGFCGGELIDETDLYLRGRYDKNLHDKDLLKRYRKEIYDFDHQFEKPTIRHKVGCGCRLCYKNPTDFRDIKEYNWWDFHDTSGERVYANGTLPLFGLWTNKYELRAPHCLKAKFDWRFNSPCTDPHKVIDGVAKSPDFPFPAECNDLGRCRIRGPLEDHIKNL